MTKIAGFVLENLTSMDDFLLLSAETVTLFVSFVVMVYSGIGFIGVLTVGSIFTSPVSKETPTFWPG